MRLLKDYEDNSEESNEQNNIKITIDGTIQKNL